MQYDLFAQATPDQIRDILDGKAEITSITHVFKGWHRITIEIEDLRQLRQIAATLRANGIKLAKSPNY